MALAVTIDGTNRVGNLLNGTITITTTKGARQGRCDFALRNVIPGMNNTLVIADGATTYFDGVVRGIDLSELKLGEFTCRVSGHDSGTPPADSIAPFALSDMTPEATYQDMMTGTNTTLGGWSDPNIFVPYAWWRLGEPSGTTAVDEMGIQNGTYVNAPTLGVTGPMANIADTAVTFNGTDEYVTCGSAHLAGQTDFSIAMWFKGTSTNATQVLYCERAATATNALVRVYLDANGRPNFQYRDDAGTLNTITPTSGDWTDGAWHLLVVTKDNTAVVIYVDGVSVKTGTLTAGDTLTGTLYAWIASDVFNAGQLFPGSLDEVMIWRSALDVIMARQLYAMRDVRTYASLTVSSVYETAAGYTTTGRIATYSSGLAPGQHIAVSSTNYGMHAIEVYVQELSIAWKNASTPLFTASIGDAPLTLAAAFP